MIKINNEIVKQEIIEELQSYERKIEDLEETLHQKNQALEQKDKAIEEAILELLKMNMSIAQIATVFNVTEKEVEALKSN